ncbi:MAG: DUF3330 domain-containing protein [Sulfuritalea sp.]|nr:DUF3330 domain-containing protein [Sulfuritalea sp.]
MTNTAEKQICESLIACDIRRKDAPLSAAFTLDGAGCVQHFCCVVCYSHIVAETMMREKSGGSAKSRDTPEPIFRP